MKWIRCIVFVALLAGCTGAPEVRSVTVSRKTVESTVSSVTSGTVRAEKVAALAFGAVGRVRTLNVAVGDLVKGGQLLAELENEDLYSVLQTAEREVDRRQRLRASNSLAQAELDIAIRERDLARTAFEKSRIIAPYDGLVAELNLEVGELSQITSVEPQPLMTIVDLAPRYVRAEIDEVDLGKITVGQKARVTILALRRVPFMATVRKVVPYISSVREQDRTAEVELTIQAEGLLLPAGASADVEVIIDVHENVNAVPTRAVFGRGGHRHVFAIEGSRLKKAPIEVGLYNYDLSEILSGVPEGTEVVFPEEGLEFVDGMRVRRVS